MRTNASGIVTPCVCSALLLALLAPNAVAQVTPPPLDRLRLANGRIVLGKITACADAHLVVTARAVQQRHAIADIREIDVKSGNAELLSSIVRAALKLGNGAVACDVAATGRLLDPGSALFKAVVEYPKASDTRLKLKNAGTTLAARAAAHRKALAPRARIKRDVRRCDRNIARYQKSIDHPHYSETVTRTTRIKCSKCGGKGKVETTVVRGEDGETLRSITRRCQKCNGKGTVKKVTKTKVKKTRDVPALKRKKERETARKDALQKKLQETEDAIAKAQADLKKATAERDAILKDLNALCLKMWKDPALQKALAPQG